MRFNLQAVGLYFIFGVKLPTVSIQVFELKVALVD